MSSPSLHQQYLSSTFMNMLASVLRKVSGSNSMPETSRNAQRTAAPLIKEFQNALDRWEDDGGASAGHPGSKGSVL
jgi:hypothetical protein